MKQYKSRIIGVTGGIGAGKSEVLNYLKEHFGAALIKLDDLGGDTLEKGGACYDAAVGLFGREIIDPDGSLNHGRIAKQIFTDTDLRMKLDSFIHPRVKKAALEKIEKYREEGFHFIVIEAALLIEDHYDEICDELWYIYAGEKTRAKRLQKSRGYSKERIMNAYASQMTEGEFRAHADFVLDNDGDFAETCRMIDRRLSI